LVGPADGIYRCSGEAAACDADPVTQRRRFRPSAQGTIGAVQSREREVVQRYLIARA
jgi:hypothetical protein